MLTAAREVLDSEGLSGVSMRRVGHHLGVQAMSLYHYVASREALVNGVADLVLHDLQDEIDSKPGPLGSWADYLNQLAHRIWAFSRQHPRAFELIATRPPEQAWLRPPLRSLPGLEAFLVSLERRGLSGPAALYAYRSFTSFLLGQLLLERPGQPPAVATHQADDPAIGAPSGPERAVSGSPSPAPPVMSPGDQRVYPTVARLGAQIHEDHTDREFTLALADVVSRVDRESRAPAPRST